jgi:hypothetical protein
MDSLASEVQRSACTARVISDEVFGDDFDDFDRESVIR